MAGHYQNACFWAVAAEAPETEESAAIMALLLQHFKRGVRL